MTQTPMSERSSTPLLGEDGNKEVQNDVVAACANKDLAKLQKLLDQGASPNSRWSKGETEFPQEVKNGRGEVVDTELVVYDKDTALMLCCSSTPHRWYRSQMFPEGMSLLLDKKADPNDSGSEPHQMPLVIASCAKSTKCIKMLLEAKANPNYITPEKLSPLTLACMDLGIAPKHPCFGVERSREAIDLLLKHGAQIFPTKELFPSQDLVSLWRMQGHDEMMIPVLEKCIAEVAKPLQMKDLRLLMTSRGLFDAFIKHRFDEKLLRGSPDALTDSLRLHEMYRKYITSMPANYLTDFAVGRASIMEKVASELLTNASLEMVSALTNGCAFIDVLIESQSTTVCSSGRMHNIVDRLWEWDYVMARFMDFNFFNFLFMMLLGSMLLKVLPSQMMNGDENSSFDVMLIIWTCAIAVNEMFQFHLASLRGSVWLYFGDLWNYFDILVILLTAAGCIVYVTGACEAKFGNDLFSISMLIQAIRNLYPLSIVSENMSLLIMSMKESLKVLAKSIVVIIFIAISFSFCFTLLMDLEQVEELVKQPTEADKSIMERIAYTSYILISHGETSTAEIIEKGFKSNPFIFVVGILFYIVVSVGSMNMIIGLMGNEAMKVEGTAKEYNLLSKLEAGRDFKWPRVSGLMPPPFNLLMLPFVPIVGPDFWSKKRVSRVLFFFVLYFNFGDHSRWYVRDNLQLGRKWMWIYHWCTRFALVALFYEVFIGSVGIPVMVFTGAMLACCLYLALHQSWINNIYSLEEKNSGFIKGNIPNWLHPDLLPPQDSKEGPSMRFGVELVEKALQKAQDSTPTERGLQKEFALMKMELTDIKEQLAELTALVRTKS